VRVEGKGERLSAEESQRYFDTRARGSRLGAWASQQSSVLRLRQVESAMGNDGQQQDDGRAELEERVKEVQRRFEGQDKIPVPEFWGGLRVVPEMVEFWQGRESRLHDRLRYDKVEQWKGDSGGEWEIKRLSP